ncbi:methyl-accepting chemotaxis protein [Desulfovibrio desulfuricans]|uniref:methyl-accepting chemotaxis protein n=1 Tax=Desulfovibrio desulfuricans TaxID=876 RepID=UPI001FD841CF|nr:methyl-accepting chemotaxis protein [Desulfovibrio desulfuricans]MDD3683375.1 methyl-accepting chemotaxis protein [Desulfovibrio desulfuricans]
MKLGLLAKMGISILTPAIVGLMLVAGVCYKMSEEILREQIATDMNALLECQSIGLDAVFSGIEQGLQTMTENQRIKDQVEAYSRSKDEALEGSLFTRADHALDSFVTNNDAVSSAAIIAMDGTVLGYRVDKQQGKNKFVGANFSDREYFVKSKNGQPSVVGMVDATTGEVFTVLAMPLKLDGKNMAVLAAAIDSKILGKNTTDKIKIGQKGMVYAYDLQGRMVLNPDGSALGRNDSKMPHVAALLQQKEGRTRFDNGKGEKGLYYKPLPHEGWILCVEFDRGEIFKPISDLLTNASLLTLACALIVGTMIFFSARGIVRMVGGISGVAEAVAGGRLETDDKERALFNAAEKRGDEFSTLAAGMRRMVQSIRHLLSESEHKTQAAQHATEEAEKATAKAEEAARQAESAKREGMLTAAGQLEEVVSVISAASTELSAQIEQSDKSAVESAQRLAEAATAMNEMNATVQEVARNASAASAVSAETRANAESGANIVENALQSIGQVHKVSLALKGDMTTLNQHAQAITQIMNVISDIADQTNLLALNAAIEAARAGEAGRGFAVVADEVRKLAEKTMASTNDVGNAISAIQGSAGQSVAAMDKALAEVEKATELAKQSGEALQGIVTKVEESADQVSAIATASEQQSATSDEINQSIVSVNEMSSQTAQAMGEASRAVSELARQAERMSELISEMKRG